MDRHGKFLIIALLLILLTGATAEAARKPKVIAHRGYWKSENAARNSITALERAIEIECYGSEFDITMTADSVLLIHHDPKTPNGLPIEETTFVRLRSDAPKLENGELIPTLDDFLTAWNNAATKLIIEIKPHATPERERAVVARVLALLDRNLVKPSKVEFISFSYDVCLEIKRLRPTAVVMPLAPGPDPEQMLADGMDGFDFHHTQFRNHPEWIELAHRHEGKINVWTVDDEQTMREMIALGVDCITTNEPLLLQQVLRSKRR